MQDNTSKCPKCDGTGYTTYYAVTLRYRIRCDVCDGTGQAPKPRIVRADQATTAK